VHWFVAFLVVCCLSNVLHEVGHWICFTAAGIPAAISLDHTYYTERWAPSFWGAAGGPFTSVLAAWLGLLLLRVAPRAAPWGVALALFMPLTRLIAYALFAILPHARMEVNDEGVMGADLGWRPWTWAWILLPFLLGAWVALWRRLPWRQPAKAGLFAGAAVAWLVIVFGVEAMMLDPRLFPEAEARELVMPHPPKEIR
jgi:hypothetical protein